MGFGMLKLRLEVKDTMPNCPKCGTALTRVSGTGTYYCGNAACSIKNIKMHIPVEQRTDAGVGRSTKPVSKSSSFGTTTSSTKDSR